MKALVVSAPGQFDWADLPMPEPGPTDALVRIEVCGICNSTDSELVEGTQPYRPPFPFVLGHESVGTVLDVGSEVTRYRPGDRVTRVAWVLPGEQREGLASGWGGFAEFGLVRDAADNYTSQRQVVLPPELAPEDAFLSISLAETRAFVEQVGEIAGWQRGLPAVVLGTGIAGLTLTRWVKDAGCDPVITLGRRAERLELARRAGADLALRSDAADLAEQVRDATGGRMAPYLFEAIGKPALLPEFAPLLADGATVAVYGAAPPAEYQAAFDQLPEGVTALRPGPEEFRYTRKVAEELADGTLDTSLWRSHVWRPDEIHEAFREVAAGDVVKGCVRFHE